ncbi:hypothetical protein [Actinacidiphila sp. ITFR-21]|nr:hypothetical protein [Streptomyces sp. ITFR-21]WNI16271.1 hypothetical protein RLT57_12525 [Streptomyces sp. ITFR-21]
MSGQAVRRDAAAGHDRLQSPCDALLLAAPDDAAATDDRTQLLAELTPA